VGCNADNRLPADALELRQQWPEPRPGIDQEVMVSSPDVPDVAPCERMNVRLPQVQNTISQVPALVPPLRDFSHVSGPTCAKAVEFANVGGRRARAAGATHGHP
jgi:hypothetical protein